MGMRVLRWFSVLALAAALACASADTALRRAAEPDPGWVLFTELETRLLRARTVELHATMSASGAVDADVNADLWLGEGQRARLAVKGTFQGRPVDALWVSDGVHAVVRGAPAVGAPPEAREALVRGLLAMGLMHNAAVLVAGEGPDHAGGGVREFVRADAPHMAEEGLVVALDVVVQNQRRGAATLALDAQGLPRDRVQRVEFETGTMKVREIYSGVVLDGPLDASLFSLQSPAPAVAPEPAPLVPSAPVVAPVTPVAPSG